MIGQAHHQEPINPTRMVSHRRHLFDMQQVQFYHRMQVSKDSLMWTLTRARCILLYRLPLRFLELPRVYKHVPSLYLWNMLYYRAGIGC